ILPGTTNEEVLTLGHTSEQGAHDNATGVAATLEALAALHRLIEAGRLPKPKRGIRVLSMGEMYGSMHYIANNQDRVRRTVAALCLDTPAAAYEIAGTEYSFYMNPHVAKDFTDALILKVAETYLPKVRRPWHEKDFATGTDTYMAEPMIGIPTIWAYSGSGVETHHNSEDTPDRVDARSLRDITIIGAAFLYAIANAGEEEARWLASLSETRGYTQILKATEKGAERVRYILDRESQAVRSVVRLAPADRRDALQATLQPAIARLRAFADLQLHRAGAGAPLRTQHEASTLIVRRKRIGSIPLDDLPHAQWEGYPSGAWASIPTHALYWCDGKRSLAEVAQLTQLELGPTSFDFVGYFRFLAKHGYVELLKHTP
ncbi:MAG: M28 family peptidase, partial [Bryobacterales bacterium]|nr:M28 family peptidase [Bryobacterales bacterium]